MSDPLENAFCHSMVQCTEMPYYTSDYLSPKLLYLYCLAHDSYEYKALGICLSFIFVYIRLHNRMNNIYVSVGNACGEALFWLTSKKLWVHNLNNCMINQLGIMMKLWSHMLLCTTDQSGSVYQDIKTLILLPVCDVNTTLCMSKKADVVSTCSICSVVEMWYACF